MNTKQLYRLAWKEVRTLRALWWTLIITAIVLQYGLVWFFDPWFTDRYPRKDWLFGVALTLPVIYAWACSALSFAVEKEEGTDQFLSRMAAPPLSLLGVKLGVCVASTLTMFGVLYFLVLFVAALVIPEIWQRLVPELEHIPQWRLEALAWAVGFWSFGAFFSLVFRRVLPCLFATALATTALPLVPSALCGVEGSSERLGWFVRLGIAPALLLLASVWLVQTWDENRWPRLLERLFRFGHKLSRWRLRISLLSLDAATTANISTSNDVRSILRTNLGSCTGILQFFLQPFGLCLPDEWLPAWRREAQRLLWLEWRSAWKVTLGLVVAGAVLVVFVLSFGSQADLRFALNILPLILAVVVFVLRVWSFHGEQREQRFRFFATHGASPIAMWVTKHVVWLSCAVMAVVALLCVSTMVSQRAIFEKEIMEGGMRAVVEAARDRRMGWNEGSPVEPLDRFVFCLSNATKTSFDVVFDPKDLPSSWPLISLMVLSIGRGFVAVWLCFTLGQLVSLLIPRAVTSMLVGLIVLGVTVAWWLMISIFQVPLVIAVLPVLIGLLAGTWCRMSDWLEERSSWRRWLRLVASTLMPMLMAFGGMAAYRVYEVPFVALPWQPPGPASAEARQTGEDWLRLSERLETPWESPDAPKKMVGDGFFPVMDMDLNRIKEAHWHGFAEREWLTKNSAILEEALQLANRPECFMPNSWDPFDDRKRKQFGRLAMLLKMSAFESLAQHRLDEALRRALALYHFGQQLGHSHNGREQWSRGLDVQQAALHVLREWAMSADQTQESLRAALGRSDLGTLHPVAQLLRAEKSFAIDPQEPLRTEYAYAVSMRELRWREAAAPYRWAFWEKSREERLLKVLAAEATATINHRLIQLPWPNLYRFNAWYDRLLRNRDEERSGNSLGPMSHGQRWQQTTLDVQLGWGWSQYEASNFFLPTLVTLETHRRGLWLTIALQAYRQQHGQLPEHLDELVGPFMDRLPADPISGQAFDYRPRGLSTIVMCDSRRLAANTPFLSAPGDRGARREPITNDYRRQNGITLDDSQINGDVNWVSVIANPYQYGAVIQETFGTYSDTFSLTPSF